jgi:FKBP-type peptidyl-prolyl cis-trans isomerase SlyD
MGLHLRDQSGRTIEAYVADIRPEGILFDFNHPLAGETLYFQVKVSALRPATSEELAHGHVHSSGDEH